MKHNSQKYLLTTGAGFLMIFIVFTSLSLSSKPLLFGLKKAKFPKVELSVKTEKHLTENKISNKSSIKKSKIATLKTDNEKPVELDTTSGERVLLIGDSQLEGLRKPVLKACQANGHQLVATVLWYGSSTKNWSISDTMSVFIKKYKPTYVIIALGLNDLFFNDLDDRREYTAKMLQTIKDNDLKYYWIGPAAWKKDLGITDILAEMNGELFYPSHKLTLERRADKRHPSLKASQIWFDKVAEEMSKLKVNKLDLTCKQNPDLSKVKSPFIILKPFYY